jgi:hypothetical protein
MNLFRFQSRRNARPSSNAKPVRLSDPVAQAMKTGDRRAADVMWFGGVTFRAER